MYNEYFGFSESPFDAAPDSRFFYSNRVYQEAFTGLRWGIELRRGLIVMTGPTGAGKTTLLRMVAEKFEPNTRAVLISRHHGDFSELLRRLLIDFGLPNIPDDRPKMMQELSSYMTARFKEDRVVGVLLDEAQDIDVPTLNQLELLLDLVTDDNKLLQIVLVGSPQLETKLEHPNLRSIRQRVALWCRLAPLTDHEVSSYIDYRVMQAGHTAEDLFAPGAVEQIAHFSKGIPRLINMLCDNALLTAYRVGQKTISQGIIHTVARDLRVTDEFEAETTETDLPGGRFHVGDPVAATQVPSVQNQVPRRKNLGLLKIANFLTIFLLTVSAAALYLFEQGKFLSPNQTDMASPATRERAEKKNYPGVLAEQSPGGTTPRQTPAAMPEPPIARQPKPLSQPQLTSADPPDQVSAKIFLHTSKPSDREILEQVADALRVKGYTIPDTRLTAGRTRGDVRFFFPRDRLAAERIKSIVEAEFAERGYHIMLELLERDGNKFQFAAPGKIEVWVPPLPKS